MVDVKYDVVRDATFQRLSLAYAATIHCLDQELRGVAERVLPQNHSLRDWALSLLREYLSAPLEGLPDTPENAKSLHQVFLMIESFEDRFRRLDATQVKPEDGADFTD